MEAGGRRSPETCRRLAHTAHDADLASCALDASFSARVCISFGLTAASGRRPQWRGTMSNAFPETFTAHCCGCQPAAVCNTQA
jgi:hypothetical protein